MQDFDSHHLQDTINKLSGDEKNLLRLVSDKKKQELTQSYFNFDQIPGERKKRLLKKLLFTINNKLFKVKNGVNRLRFNHDSYRNLHSSIIDESDNNIVILTPIYYK